MECRVPLGVHVTESNTGNNLKPLLFREFDFNAVRSSWHVRPLSPLSTSQCCFSDRVGMDGHSIDPYLLDGPILRVGETGSSTLTQTEHLMA